MYKQTRVVGLLTVLLIVSIANFSRISSGTIRTVDFVTIWVIGALSGLLIYKVIELIKKK